MRISSDGLKEESITRAVAAPTPDTLKRWRNTSFSDLIPPEIWTDFINEANQRMKNFFGSKPDNTLLLSFLRQFEISFKENNPKNIIWNSNAYEDGTVTRGKKNKTPYAFDNTYFRGKDYYRLHEFQSVGKPFDFLKC
jgi:hypothetical protein